MQRLGAGVALRDCVRAPEPEARARFRAADSRTSFVTSRASLKSALSAGHAVRGSLLGDPAGAAQFRERSPLLPPRLAAAGRGEGGGPELGGALPAARQGTCCCLASGSACAVNSCVNSAH